MLLHIVISKTTRKRIDDDNAIAILKKELLQLLIQISMLSNVDTFPSVKGKSYFAIYEVSRIIIQRF